MTRLKIRRRLHKWVARLQRWLSKEEFDQLREFVYLDEISVRSLLASTGEGGIISETVNEETQTSRSSTKAGGSISGGAASVSGEATEEQERQKTVTQTRNYDLIQSKFTRLYKSDKVEKKLSLDQVQINNSAEERFTGLKTSDLGRSDIIELRVNLSANLLFRMYQTTDYFARVFEEEVDDEAEEILELIQMSLGNWIPVVGEAVDYEVVDGDEKTIKRINQVDDDEDTQDLKIVTLLNLDSLWVDPIQTLFKNDRFVVYCRVEDVGIDRWYPLKVTRAVDSLSESTARELNREFRQGLEEMRTQLSEIHLNTRSTDIAVRWRNDIQQYTEALEEEFDLEVSDEQQQQLLNETERQIELGYEGSKTAQRKKILNAYTEAFIELFDLDSISQKRRQELRPEASVLPHEFQGDNQIDDENNAFRIEAKTVAMYW